MYIYKHIYIYICIYLNIYLYIYICVCVYVHSTHRQTEQLQNGCNRGSNPPFGLTAVSQPTSNRDFVRPSLRIKLGDSGGDKNSRGNCNDRRKGTGSDAHGSDVAWSVSNLISILTSGTTILPIIFQHHTA